MLTASAFNGRYMRETRGADLWDTHALREGPDAHPSQNRGRVGHAENMGSSNRKTQKDKTIEP